MLFRAAGRRLHRARTGQRRCRRSPAGLDEHLLRRLGDLWESPSDHEYGLVRVGNDPTLQLPALLDPDTFVELGFTWQADRVRYFATVDGTDRTLWELTDPTHIPTLPASVMFNVWHPAEHWFGNGAPPDYPAQDATLLVDWVRYWED